MAKTSNDKRREANRDDAKAHLRAAVKALTGKELDESEAAAEIARASALLDQNKQLAEV